MTGFLLPTVVWRAVDSAGAPLNGAKLYFFVTGTTTPTNTYTTSTLGTPNANPVVSDSAGLFGPIYLDPAVTYRVQLKTSAGSLIEDIDPFTVAANVPPGGITGAMLAAGAVNTNLTYTAANAALVLLQGLHTLSIPAGAFVATTTNGSTPTTTQSTTNHVMVASQDFDQSTAQYAQVAIPLPKGVSSGAFTARLRWTSASGSGDVIWRVQALALSDGDTIDTAFGTAISVTDTLSSAGNIQTSPTTAAITASNGLAKQDVLIVQVSRDAANVADTLNASAKLTAVELFFTLDATTDA